MIVATSPGRTDSAPARYAARRGSSSTAAPRASSVLYDRKGSAIAEVKPGMVDWKAVFAGSKWFHVTDATVYFDHPVHAMAEHTLNIDLTDPSRGPGARLAVELTRDSATRLVRAIEEALASAPEGV